MTQTETQAHKWREGEGSFIRAHLALTPMPDEDGAPTRVCALPWGEVKLRDAAIREYFDEPGALLVNERSAAEIAENFAKRDVDCFVNLNHNSYGPAYGWIKDVEAVPDEGIYIDVEWTPNGARLVQERTYRYSSIEVILDARAWAVDGSPAVVVAVVGLALTNTPAVVGQAPVAFQSLKAALSASDGRELQARNNSPGDAGEKGVLHMSESIFKGLFSRAAGREPSDDVDAATMAAELKQIRENHEQLTADLAASTSKAVELAENLDKANQTISDMKTAEIERAKAGQLAQVELAVKEGRIPMAQSELAQEDPETFLKIAEKTPVGTFSPPTGLQVTSKATDSVDTTSLANSGIAEHAEIEAYAKEHNVRFHEAALAVKKQRSGKGE